MAKKNAKREKPAAVKYAIKVTAFNSKGQRYLEAEFENPSDAASFAKGIAARGRPVGTKSERSGRPRKRGRAKSRIRETAE